MAAPPLTPDDLFRAWSYVARSTSISSAPGGLSFRQPYLVFGVPEEGNAPLERRWGWRLLVVGPTPGVNFSIPHLEATARYNVGRYLAEGGAACVLLGSGLLSTAGAVVEPEPAALLHPAEDWRGRLEAAVERFQGMCRGEG